MKVNRWNWLACLMCLVSIVGITNAAALTSNGSATRADMPVDTTRDASTPTGPETHAGETSTYLRCYYETSDDERKFDTRYVWAMDPGSNTRYALRGEWHGGRKYHWQALFYTDVSPGDLRSLCENSLHRQGIFSRVIMYSAGDGALAFDYAPWSAGTRGAGIDRIVAFGDSLSDTHNLYNASRRLMPDGTSWFAGRFTNGRNWVEYLADDMGVPLYDWAVGGVGVADRPVFPWADLPGVLSQTRQWRDATQYDPTYDPGRTLFTMLVGGNDLIYFNTPVEEILAKERTALQVLIDGGARNILVLNLPDVSRAPIFQLESGAGDVAAKVRRINAGLVSMVADIQQQSGASLNIQLFDTNALFTHLFDQPRIYDFQNITQSCLKIDDKGFSNFMESHALRAGCRDPDTFVFWDILHPTTHTHRILADEVAAFVRERYKSAGLPDAATPGRARSGST
jgi:thermolabile hemolysin